MKDERHRLYVPANIKTRFELVDGFGFEELFKTGIVTALSILVALLVYTITGDNYKAVFIVLITAAVMFTLVRKNESNQSILDILGLIIRFQRIQQKYGYEFTSKYPAKEAAADERPKKPKLHRTV
ncbi:MAG: hypothetical protein LBU94_05070 [Clostridiales bacterium]|jgi:hypothetical protein|nr:hypothetical protein [Clostridiales bacterium]